MEKQNMRISKRKKVKANITLPSGLVNDAKLSGLVLSHEAELGLFLTLSIRNVCPYNEKETCNQKCDKTYSSWRTCNKNQFKN